MNSQRVIAIRRLIPWSVVALAIWIALQFYEAGDHRWMDHGLTISLALSSGFAALIMLESQREWRTRAVGVFFLALGWTFLFGSTELNRVWGPEYNPPPLPSDYPLPPPRPVWLEMSLDAVRSLTFVGSMLLIHGLLEYRFRSESVDVWDGKDRRETKPGRREVDLSRYKVSQQLEEMRGD